jgi:hypothetical protein
MRVLPACAAESKSCPICTLHSLQWARARHLPTPVPQPKRREITTCTFPHHRQNSVDMPLRDGTYNPVEGEALYTREGGMIVQTTDVKG